MAKYNLDRLGWKAFQDLTATIMQHIVGATYVPFGRGKDGGRDGFFQGSVSRTTVDTMGDLTGKVVFQCKHTSNPGNLRASLLHDEVPKVKELVRLGELDSYVVVTNYRVSGPNERAIRTVFVDEAKVKVCKILGEEWLERTIESHPVLRRLVPTLYGIGDITRIIDNRVLEQSMAQIEELRDRARTFVSTAAYQKALLAIEQRGFVLLLGPPGAGKSSVAANICLSGLAEKRYTERSYSRPRPNSKPIGILILQNGSIGSTTHLERHH